VSIASAPFRNEDGVRGNGPVNDGVPMVCEAAVSRAYVEGPPALESAARLHYVIFLFIIDLPAEDRRPRGRFLWCWDHRPELAITLRHGCVRSPSRARSNDHMRNRPATCLDKLFPKKERRS